MLWGPQEKAVNSRLSQDLLPRGDGNIESGPGRNQQGKTKCEQSRLNKEHPS